MPSGWIDKHGEEHLAEDLSDHHLANIIHFILHSGHFRPDDASGFIEEAQKRELSPYFLSKAPYPYRDKAGDWVLWNYEKKKAVFIGECCLTDMEK